MTVSIWRKLHRIWIVTGATVGIVFVGWSVLAYRATSVARQALETDAAVTVTSGDGYWSFTPRGQAAAGLILFPGGLVDPAAYAPLTHAVTVAGYPAVLVRVPMRGAFGSADSPAVVGRALAATRNHGSVRAWVVAGHSRGGVIALERTRANLPASTRMVPIEGGNHSQFGYYGFQPFDWPAAISRDAQQAITRRAVLEALTAAAVR